MIIKMRYVINSDTGEKVLQAYDGDSWKIVPTIYGESVTIEQVKLTDNIEMLRDAPVRTLKECREISRKAVEVLRAGNPEE